MMDKHSDDSGIPSGTGAPKHAWRAVFDVVTTLAMLSLAIGLFVNGRHKPPDRQPRPSIAIPELPIEADGDVSRGSASAKAVMIEYSDFQCPYCASFSRETLPTIDTEYLQTGRVRFIFRHLPLPMHSQAQKAAEAAECAGRQGRFWDMHDSLFARPTDLDIRGLSRRAAELQLDLDVFDDCLKGAEAENVRTDAQGAGLFKITATPSFLFGTAEPDGRIKIISAMSGAQPVSAFREQLDRIANHPTR